MKIIDVRKIDEHTFYIYYGDDKEYDWWGDDWDDRGCEDIVYDRYVKKVEKVVLPENQVVYTPFDFYEMEEKVSKQAIKYHLFPMFFIAHKDSAWYTYTSQEPNIVVMSGESYRTISIGLIAINADVEESTYEKSVDWE